MAWFKSKPSKLEAFQYTGLPRYSTQPEGFPDAIKWEKVFNQLTGDYEYLPTIVTIHDQKVHLMTDDWVATEPDGIHHYPIKPDIFEKRWEPLGA